MIRTRDVLVSIIVFTCASILGAFMVTYRGEDVKSPTPEHTTQEAVFFTPRDEYRVTPHTDDTLSGSRESFIEKVRNTYPKEINTEELNGTISAPVTEVPLRETASSTSYGDTRL